MDPKKKRLTSTLAVILLSINVFLIVLGVLWSYTSIYLFNYAVYNVGYDHGYGEIFLYAQELLIIFMLLFLAVNRRVALYFGWSLLFCFFLIDDAFRIHEYFGETIAQKYSLQPFMGLRSIDFGELVSTGVFGISLVLLVLVIWRQCHDAEALCFSRFMFLFILGLGFFGVFVDMFDVVFDYRIFSLIEDGGEMIVMSLIFWFVSTYFLSNAREVRLREADGRIAA
jgi:hypothetical protein